MTGKKALPISQPKRKPGELALGEGGGKATEPPLQCWQGVLLEGIRRGGKTRKGTDGSEKRR